MNAFSRASLDPLVARLVQEPTDHLPEVVETLPPAGVDALDRVVEDDDDRCLEGMRRGKGGRELRRPRVDVHAEPARSGLAADRLGAFRDDPSAGELHELRAELHGQIADLGHRPVRELASVDSEWTRHRQAPFARPRHSGTGSLGFGGHTNRVKPTTRSTRSTTAVVNTISSTEMAAIVGSLANSM